ncbi:hypothetical protein EKO23_09715 [Nocardioides guangzhouensis]|uniref:Uncharacterized protein n=1 Tax=Nocardioides guangzhouensis TaxID=2497878 RepID=A0A4Q4ZEY7_9ACTN|nr:hypothetical protein [Nocardioides guangzhouensis]RYP86225.1 hypothetical protein EKO23_09715 [Nocardioides guangzhouensis]
MRVIKPAALAVLSLGVAIAASLSMSSSATAADGWHVSSVYGYRTVWPGSAGALVARVTVAVPDGVMSVDFETDQAHGSATVFDGRVVLELNQLVDEHGNPLDTPLRLVPPTGEAWATTIGVPAPATTTTLTITSGKQPTSRAAGSKVRMTGTLTADGEPLAGHWVAIADVRVDPNCEDGACGEHYVSRAQGQVDSAGNWQASVPLGWTSNLAASYCRFASSCWDNPNAPAFDLGPKIKTFWAPAISGPTKGRAGRRATFEVRTPAAYSGLPVKLQALRGTGWRTVAVKRVTTSTTVRLVTRLTTGRHRLRAVVPSTRRSWFGTQPWELLAVTAGTSRVTVVRVTR